jgi:hypothetical protein
MFDQDPEDMSEIVAERSGGKEQMQGDGMHHHTIDEDEGGGYHSVHTHPNGHEDHDDHTTYEEARDKMDQDFGKGEGDDDKDGGESSVGDMNASDIAGSYGRAADCN